MNKNILIGIMVGATILITGWYVSVLNTPVAFEMVPPPDVNTNTHLQITADEEHEQIDVVEPPAVTQFDWSTFISDAGFQFQYPSTWQVTDNLSRGQDYELLARIVNPARAGRPETDIPIEQFLIRRMDTTCKESTSSFSCSAAYDSGWVDDVFAPGVIYRTICIPTEGWPIEIYASAFDEPSRVIMDTMIASFEFTRAR